MKVRNKRLATAIVALAAVSVIATGCGGAKASSSTGGGSQTTIKIGIGAPLTAGAVAQGQGIERGARLAIKEANASDEAKKLGIKFEGVAGDDQGDPKTGVNVANTFASDANLLGVVGHQNSGVSIPASKVYNDKKIVMISPASTNPALTTQGFNNVFRVCTIDSVQGPVAADSALGEKVGAKTAVVIDDSTPFGEGLAAEFAKEFQAKGGKVLFTEKTSDKDTDFNALSTKIKSAGPDVVYYGGVYNAGSLLSKQMSDAGVTAPMMGGDALYDPEYIKLAGTQSEGDMVTSVGLPMDLMPDGKKFQESFKAEYPDAQIGAYDAYAYDAANVIIDAILKVAGEQGVAKLRTPAGKDAIIKAVAATKKQGVTGEIGFDSNGDTTNKAITVYRVEQGAFKPFIVPSK